MKRNVFILAILLCVSCAKESDKGIIPLPLKESIGIDSKREKVDIFENIHVIPLETTDQSLLSGCYIINVCDDKLFVEDANTVYSFNAETGKYESSMHRQGSGPEEYVSLSDVCVDCSNRLLHVLERTRNKIKTYNYDGHFLREYAHDSIEAIEMLDGSYFVANKGMNGQCDIGLYDKNWNIVKNLWNNNKGKVEYKHIAQIQDFQVFNDCTVFMDADTLYQIKNKEVNALFYINKENLSMPFEVLTDVTRQKEWDSYIWGNLGYLSGNYYFLRFYYENKLYYDVWDVSSMKLIYRNTASSPADIMGISVSVNGENIDIWPSFVKNDRIYSILSFEDAKKLDLPDDNEENPVIVACDIKPQVK